MPRTKVTESGFSYDEQGRAILGSAKEMAAWVKLKFAEQNKKRRPDDPFQSNYIDLSKCVLYVSYPVGRKEVETKIFNFCDIAGIVPGIEKVEGNPDCLFEVTYDIRFDGSVLYGNFFHYVKFDGLVGMDDVIVRNGSFSCFKCNFDGFVYMQRIHLQGGFDFEQCVFSKGLFMSGAFVDGINSSFNNCTFNERLSLVSTTFKNENLKSHAQSIAFTNSTIDNLNVSKIETNGIPIFMENTMIKGMKLDNIQLNSSLGFYSCVLDDICTSVKDEDSPDNFLKELVFFNCTVRAQCYIEHVNIGKFTFSFGKIDGTGRIRLLQCKADDFMFGAASVSGQLDIFESRITFFDLEGTIVDGHILFQDNNVTEYKNRQTVRLLKDEALKVNDDVSATHLFAKEMNLLLNDKSVPCWDKISLWLNKFFSGFGENWAQAIGLTMLISIVLTLLMLGFGSAKYMFVTSGEFIGFGPFVTILLDSINVFSIPLFSDTVKEYGLNVVGQILYFIIKIVVAYGCYQFVAAFRKYGRH